MNTQKWKKFENLVAKIQQEFAPDAIVTLNDKIVGKITERKRQIDISIKQKIAQYDILVVVDCKDYSVPVDVKAVGEVLELVEDVGANKGVIVSASGFTSSAKKRGKAAGLDLLRLADCGDHNWKVEIAIPMLCDFRKIKGYKFKFSGVGGPQRIRIPCQDPREMEVFDNNNNLIGKTDDLLKDAWNRHEISIEPGEYKDIEFIKHPTRVKEGNEFFNIRITATVYIEKNIYQGYIPLKKFSGFKDEIKGHLMTNSFTTDWLDTQRVEKEWKKVTLDQEVEANQKCVLKLVASDYYEKKQ